MDLRFKTEIASAYKSSSQIARIVSEDWCARELYCANCHCDRLVQSRNNTAVIDFTCNECGEDFQLKSFKTWHQKRIPDAAYSTMIHAIRTNMAPNLLVLQYSPFLAVHNLLLIPSAFLTESVIERRNPLGQLARRAGWVGCNIALWRIPTDGKISIVTCGVPASKCRVREEFARIRGLNQLSPSMRGWSTDVLLLIRKLGKKKFSLDELYQFEPELQQLHPQNHFVRPKIRQQLQVLRDLGLLAFASRGTYVLTG